jgi:hypothetical protein
MYWLKDIPYINGKDLYFSHSLKGASTLGGIAAKSQKEAELETAYLQKQWLEDD